MNPFFVPAGINEQQTAVIYVKSIGIDSKVNETTRDPLQGIQCHTATEATELANYAGMTEPHAAEVTITLRSIVPDSSFNLGRAQ